MTDRVRDQLKQLGIRDAPARSRQLRSDLSDVRHFRDCLWGMEAYEEIVRFVRSRISAELSRKLEHIITPPKAMGLAEDVSRDSIKWFVEYWWTACKDYSPDLYVAQDNTVVAVWREKWCLIRVRFFSSGYALASIRQTGEGKKGRSTFWTAVRELPTSFVW